MSLLRTIESRIAAVVEGTFGKVFRSHVQPVELARRLAREMDEHQQPTLRRVYVPNVYEVYLSADDFGNFGESRTALQAELGEYLAEHARRSGYAVVGRPRVTIKRDTDLDLGAFGIACRTEGTPEDDVPPVPAAAPSATMVYRPDPDGAPAREAFRLVTPDGEVQLDSTRTKIGRGKSNDVVLHDSSVSREHAEVVQQGVGFLVRDLDSTNGVMVNGSRVREQVLMPGDVLLLGNCELRFERAPDGAARQ